MTKTLFDKSVAREQVLFSNASFSPGDYPDDARPTTGTRQEFSEMDGRYCDPEELQSIRENYGIGLDDDGDDEETEEEEEENLEQILAKGLENHENKVKPAETNVIPMLGEEGDDSTRQNLFADDGDSFVPRCQHRLGGIGRNVFSSARRRRKREKNALRKLTGARIA